MKSIDKEKKQGNSIAISVLIGVLTGFINGIFGGGGGMIVVPMLIYFLKIPTKCAHATAILIILPLSIVSGLFYARFGGNFISALIPTMSGVVLGGVLGALFLKKMTSKWATVIFSVLMMFAGIKMIFFR